MHSKHELQAQGLAQTHGGEYQAAARTLEDALLGTVGIQRANILRDLADAERRIPPTSQNCERARLHLLESVNLLSPEDNPVEWASSIHYLARLLRQQGSNTAAADQLYRAENVMAEYNELLRARGENGHPEMMFLLLDFASVVGLLGQSSRCRKLAMKSLRFAHSNPNTAITHKHIFRGWIIWLFAAWPTCDWPIVHRAFQGRTR